MIIRPSNQRGAANFGWLDSRHTFSFGHYYDPAHMGYGPLRVINEDRVAPGGGFPPHGHRDMEIISYVLDGALEHKDDIGNGSVIRPGDVQRMSAGTGIRHSEYNASETAPVHFLQIWILPSEEGIAPGYEETHFDATDLANGLRLIGSPDGSDGSVTIHQDVLLYAARLDADRRIAHRLDADRIAWLHVARGQVTANGARLSAGDAAAFEAGTEIAIADAAAAEVLLFDMVA